MSNKVLVLLNLQDCKIRHCRREILCKCLESVEEVELAHCVTTSLANDELAFFVAEDRLQVQRADVEGLLRVATVRHVGVGDFELDLARAGLQAVRR